ncbi:hydrolase [Trinickia caryophylli]|nr:hydrolase [Trinickia caryophylli]TRX15319.1 hydrolase [Trinickia caryophylli]
MAGRLRLSLAALCLALGACATQPSPTTRQAYTDPIALYPMAAYDQNVDRWIDPSSPGYDKPFLGAADQRRHLDALYARYFGTLARDPSPWNAAFIDSRVYVKHGEDIVDLQLRRIGRYDNEGKADKRIGYGQNYRPHTSAWIDAIETNMDIAQFTRAPHYVPDARSIAVDNLLVRELPTMDPSFFSHTLAGEGYPFDNLQVSGVRPGTPLYVLGRSADRAWAYVQTPDVQGWVQARGLASIDDAFANDWRRAARASWGAIIAASAAVTDENGVFRFEAPAGTLLPLVNATAAATTATASAPATPATAPAARYTVLVPARGIDGHAVARRAHLTANQVAPMPLAATPRHLAQLIKALIGRPYGWGNTGFYNDCSSELQSMFAAFGIWLPRHSSTQMSAGHMTDLSADTPAERVDYLLRHGEPMRTLIYIGGHVMLYLGPIRRDGQTVPLVYQDIWGLRPADDSRRAVIGGSAILPLLLRIPEDPALQSLAGTPTFQMSVIGSPSGSAPAADEENPAG